MAGEKNTISISYASQIDKLCLPENFVRSSYLPYVQQNKRSWKTDERYLNRYILPYIGNSPLTEISEEEHREGFYFLESNGSSLCSCYHLFGLAKYILNFVIRVGVFKSNAVFQSMAVRKNKSQRVLKFFTPAEVLKLVYMLKEYADRSSHRLSIFFYSTGEE